MTLFVDDTDFQLHVGDVRQVLATLPDESVHCVVTSPPYWGLRDYGTGSWDGGDPECDHTTPRSRGDDTEGWKQATSAGSRPNTNLDCKCGARRVDQQLGLEPTPDLYVQNMVAVFRELRRVLRRDGTCWLNIGDSYVAGQGGRQSNVGELPPVHRNDRIEPPARDPDLPNPPSGWAERQMTTRTYPSRDTGLKPKDLVGIPWRLAFALQADGWYLRSDIIWAKPNPMPESVTDRPTKAHEYVFLLTRSPRYFFDQEAVREASITNDPRRPYTSQGAKDLDGRSEWHSGEHRNGDDFSGRNVRSVWEIATQPYAQAHFATFPEALVERCVKAGTSERGCCPACGAPWERETKESSGGVRGPEWNKGHSNRLLEGHRKPSGQKAWDEYRPRETLGWRPTCACYFDGGAYERYFKGRALERLEPKIPGVVLDPFIGSGTTALVARRLGRHTIGIELSPAYAELCARRTQQLSVLA